eukprot:30593-Eustigmatos_ZCMA.PRE.1
MSTDSYGMLASARRDDVRPKTTEPTTRGVSSRRTDMTRCSVIPGVRVVLSEEFVLRLSDSCP